MDFSPIILQRRCSDEADPSLDATEKTRSSGKTRIDLMFVNIKPLVDILCGDGGKFREPLRRAFLKVAFFTPKNENVPFLPYKLFGSNQHRDGLRDGLQELPVSRPSSRILRFPVRTWPSHALFAPFAAATCHDTSGPGSFAENFG